MEVHYKLIDILLSLQSCQKNHGKQAFFEVHRKYTIAQQPSKVLYLSH